MLPDRDSNGPAPSVGVWTKDILQSSACCSRRLRTVLSLRRHCGLCRRCVSIGSRPTSKSDTIRVVVNGEAKGYGQVSIVNVVMAYMLNFTSYTVGCGATLYYCEAIDRTAIEPEKTKPVRRVNDDNTQKQYFLPRSPCMKSIVLTKGAKVV